MPRPSDKKRRQGPEATDHEPPTPHAGGADTSIESECVPPLHDLVIATLRIAMDGFCVIDAKGQLLDANQALCDLLGYSRDELLRMSIGDLEAVESPEGIARHIAEIQAEGRDRFVTRHRRKDGAIVDVEVSTHYVPDRGGIFLSFLRDVSEYLQKERSLRSARDVLQREVSRQAAEARLLRTAVEQLPVSVLLTDAQGGIEYVNPAFTRITGYSPEEALGKTPRLLGSGVADATFYEALWDTILSGREWSGEIVNRRKDGTHYVQELVIAPIRGGEEPSRHFVGIGHDVTKRRHAEDALRESTRLLAESQHVARLGSYRLEVASGTWTSSPVLDEIFGIADATFRRDVAGWLSVVHPNERDEIAAYFTEEVLGRRRRFDREYRIVRRNDGEERWVHGLGTLVTDGDGRTVEMFGTIQDVTERKQAEGALKATETRYRSLIEHSTDVTLLLGADGSASYLSPAFEKVLGLPTREWLGKSLFALIHPEDLALAEAMLGRCLETPGEVNRWQLRFRDAEGSWRWWDGAATNCLDDPAVEGIVVNCRDVTEEKRILHALHESEAQRDQAQKLEAVGQLAGGVAHDFNNILTIILGNAESALIGLPSQDPTAQALREIAKASKGAAALTRQLLAFSRKQVLQPKVLDLNALVTGTEKMLRRLIGEDIELSTRLHPSLWAIRADPGQLEQILMNLAVNARDAMPGGGELIFETENMEVGEARAGGGDVRMDPGRYVRLTITDTGHGIDEETRSRVFEPFFTTKAMGKGTGLGLSTVYGIVKQSAGYIWVESEPERGTSFEIYLPHVDGAPEPLRDEAANVRTSGSRTILLVEDEETLLELARSILVRAGYTVIAASNGAEALRFVEEHPEPIHLLVTDVVMPGMSGHALSERIRTLRRGLPVLYTTGYTDDAIVHHGVLDSATQLLEKPYSQSMLLSTVGKMLASRPE